MRGCGLCVHHSICILHARTVHTGVQTTVWVWGGLQSTVDALLCCWPPHDRGCGCSAAGHPTAVAYGTCIQVLWLMCGRSCCASACLPVVLA